MNVFGGITKFQVCFFFWGGGVPDNPIFVGGG